MSDAFMRTTLAFLQYLTYSSAKISAKLEIEQFRFYRHSFAQVAILQSRNALHHRFAAVLTPSPPWFFIW